MSKRQMHQISRRRFIQLAGAIAAGAVLAGAGCEPKPAGSTVTSQAPSRDNLIKYVPNARSKVVQTYHQGAWGGDDLVPNVLAQMLDASITKLTGLTDAAEAWKTLFAPHEKIAIKVNSVYTGSTHVALAIAVAEKLKQAGLPPEHITIYDRRRDELLQAGFSVNRDGAGVRCAGTDGDYASGWELVGRQIKLSNYLMGCDALINMPIFKTHIYAGITFAMKNHFGTFDMPSAFHTKLAHGLPELNALAPIKDKTRLIVGDMLTRGSIPDTVGSATVGTGDSILMAFDSVACDATGLAFAQKVQPDSQSMEAIAKTWLNAAADMKLGTNDPGKIDHIEQHIG